LLGTGVAMLRDQAAALIWAVASRVCRALVSHATVHCCIVALQAMGGGLRGCAQRVHPARPRNERQLVPVVRKLQLLLVTKPHSHTRTRTRAHALAHTHTHVILNVRPLLRGGTEHRQRRGSEESRRPRACARRARSRWHGMGVFQVPWHDCAFVRADVAVRPGSRQSRARLRRLQQSPPLQPL
jgi:hypothetical protein